MSLYKNIGIGIERFWDDYNHRVRSELGDCKIIGEGNHRQYDWDDSIYVSCTFPPRNDMYVEFRSDKCVAFVGVSLDKYKNVSVSNTPIVLFDSCTGVQQMIRDGRIDNIDTIIFNGRSIDTTDIFKFADFELRAEAFKAKFIGEYNKFTRSIKKY